MIEISEAILNLDANANFVEVIIDTQNLSENRKEHRYLDGEDNLYCIVLDDGDGRVRKVQWVIPAGGP